MSTPPSRKCSGCKNPEHTIRTCPHKAATAAATSHDTTEPKTRKTPCCSVCRKPGHNKRFCTAKIDVLPAATLFESTHPTIMTAASSSPKYQIPEISKMAFVTAIKPLYDVLENKIKAKGDAKGDDDVFLKPIISSYAGITQAQWEESELVRRRQKNIEMNMGNFHQQMLGNLPGYHVLPKGHETGCDVMRNDKALVAEVKNRHNTMNADSSKSVKQKLLVQLEKGREAYLILVNCPPGKKTPRFKLPETVKVLTGLEAYALFSGRDTFFDDLNATLKWCFASFKTHAELKMTLLPTSDEETS